WNGWRRRASTNSGRSARARRFRAWSGGSPRRRRRGPSARPRTSPRPGAETGCAGHACNTGEGDDAMFDLTGKAALVTGASGGIGGAIARALHGAGAVVGLSGTREAPLAGLAAELGERAHVLPCDLSSADAVEALPKRAAEAMGALDILVNNAGITRDNLFMRMSDAEWQQVIDVNLTSTFRLCRGVLRGMMKARWGRIVNVTSIRGTAGNPGEGHYAVAKAGIAGMSKALAQEVAR